MRVNRTLVHDSNQELAYPEFAYNFGNRVLPLYIAYFAHIHLLHFCWNHFGNQPILQAEALHQFQATSHRGFQRLSVLVMEIEVNAHIVVEMRIAAFAGIV